MKKCNQTWVINELPVLLSPAWEMIPTTSGSNGPAPVQLRCFWPTYSYFFVKTLACVMEPRFSLQNFGFSYFILTFIFKNLILATRISSENIETFKIRPFLMFALICFSSFYLFSSIISKKVPFCTLNDCTCFENSII